MDEWGLSIFTMIVGAFLGSIISPASELYFAKIFSKKGESYSVENGLLLLCAANAAWVISFILFEFSKISTYALIATLSLEPTHKLKKSNIKQIKLCNILFVI